MKKVLLKILFLVNIFAALVLLSIYLAPFVSPAVFWPVAFLGLVYPYVFFVNLFFVVFWLIVRKRYLFLSLIVILIGYNFFFRMCQFKGKKSDCPEVKVLSYNVRNFYGSGNDKKDRKNNAKNIVEFLEKEDADIICLQETRLQQSKIFNLSKAVERLENVKHYQFARSSTTLGSVTMTRYPVVNMGEIRFEKSNNIAIYTDVRIENDTVRVYNLHLQSYRIDPSNYDVLESIDINDEKKRRIYRKVAGQMRRAFIQRAAQAQKIRKHIDNCKYPVIVCGDFNDTPSSYTYRVISNNMKDAFVNSGRGIERTYVGELPSFRIDYILHDPCFESFNYESPDFHCSDHLPVTCGLKRVADK